MPPILVPIDGSEHSWFVLPHVARFAEALGVPIRLVRILNPLLDVGDEFAPSVLEAAQGVAARWKEDLDRYASDRGVKAETAVEIVGRKESVSDSIVRLAMQWESPVIALNSRGAGALHHLFLGSTSLAVLGKAERPVFLTGPRAEGSDSSRPYRAAITSDGSDAARAGVARFAGLFRGTAIEPELVGVYSAAFGDRDPMSEMADARAHLEEMRDLFPAGAHLGTHVFDAAGYESTAHAIVRGSMELGASVIAMATHGHRVVRHLVAGSTAVGVLKSSPLPLLLIPAD